MKEVTIKSKIVGRGGASAATSPGKGVSVDMSSYLLKQIWEKVFEFRLTDDGTEYLFAKMNVAAQGGFTSFVDGGKINLPGLYDGIPFDNRTIWMNPETGVVEVLVSGGEGGAADFSNVQSSGTGNAFTSFNVSADGSRLTLVKGETFALQSDLNELDERITNFLEGSDTDNIINKWKELEAFLSGMKESDDLATILATKWTKDDNKISSWDAAFGWGDHSKAGYMKKSVIYDESIGCWKLDGDLIVTGGVTSFANEGKYTPSTIMDGVRVDYDTIIVNENGELSINPDIELGGGSGESMTAQQILDKLKSVDGAGSGLDADTIDDVDSSKLFVAQRETINRDNLDVFAWRNSGSVQVMRYASSGAVIDASPLYTFRSKGSYLGLELFQEFNASGPVYKMRSIKDAGAFTPWKTIAFEESLSDTFLPLTGGKMIGHIYMGGAKETSSTSNSSQLIFGTSGNEYVAVSSNYDAVIINPNSTSTNGQVILGVNGKASEFTGGEVKVGDISIKRNADGVLLIDGDVIVSGGVTSFVNEGKYTPSTITDGVNVDGQTIIKSGGKLMLNPDIQLGGGTESITKQMVIEALGYTPYNSTNPSGYITSSGSITGNAATATTASKLDVRTKQAWGQTYWNDEGKPTNISGDMKDVGNILLNAHNTRSLGADQKGLLHVYSNYINSGHSGNNLWLVGGRANDDVGLIFTRGLDSSNHKELGRWNGYGLNIGTHVYLTKSVSNSSINNESQIIFGTKNSEHVAISSNSNAVIINPSTTSTTKQIVLGVNGVDSDFGGNLLVRGGITSYSTSDERLKENIRTFNAGETLMSLGGAYKFEYCESEVAENKRYEGIHIGLIYQKVKESTLKGMCMEREDGYGALNYLDTDFISLLAAVEMEHEQKVNGLEGKVERLERMVEQLMNK